MRPAPIHSIETGTLESDGSAIVIINRLVIIPCSSDANATRLMHAIGHAIQTYATDLTPAAQRAPEKMQ